MMENVIAITSEIKDNLVQKAASRKDEVTIMKAMLNDPTFQVGIYSKEGKTGEYSPFEDSRKMLGNVISATTKISTAEAQELSNAYEITRNDATAFVNISKEFVNTYLQTGRKLPLGGRKSMNANLSLKHVEEKDKVVPATQASGERITTRIPAHDAIRATCPCPAWLK